MEARQSSRAALAIQVAGVVALFWIALGLADVARHGAAPPPVTPASPAAGADARLQSLEARLDALAERGGPVPAAPLAAGIDPAPTPVPVARQPVGGEPRSGASIAAELAALRRELRGIAARWEPEQERMAAAARGRGADWGQLAAYRQAYAQDREGARQRLLFASASELIERFGKPTSVRASDKGEMTWYYKRTVGELEEQLRVTFRDGLVISVYAN